MSETGKPIVEVIAQLREAADSAERDYYGSNEDLMREAASALDDWRQIQNAMSDLSLGDVTRNGVLDALQDLHRLRALYPPLAERERRAVSALEAIVYHNDGPLAGVVNVTKLSDALISIARAGLAPNSPSKDNTTVRKSSGSKAKQQGTSE